MPANRVGMPVYMSTTARSAILDRILDPAVPAAMWLVLLPIGLLASWDSVAWVCIGAAAGYALSGSV
jgi:hypothetical protein